MLKTLSCRRTIIASFAIGISIPSQVAAQQLLPANINVVIEQLATDAARCNVTREGLAGAAQSALRYNRIGYSSESSTYLYVNANVINIGGNSCAVALDLSIRQGDTLPDARGGHISGIFEYCNAGQLQIGPDAATRLYATTKNLIDQCLADIKANPEASLSRTLRQYLNDKAKEEPAQ